MIVTAMMVITVSAHATSVKLSGLRFGTIPSATGSKYDKASDENISTFFDASSASEGYTGIDLGANTKSVVKRITFRCRPGFGSRMTGGKFQGSNTSQTGGYTDLHTITAEPQGDNMENVAILNNTAYRYLRYLGPAKSNCNIAEMGFYADEKVPKAEYSMEVVENSASTPLINLPTVGFEGGCVMQYTPVGQTTPEIHMFVTELTNGAWEFTHTGHWKSTDDGSTWARHCTFQTHIKGTSKQSIWSPMPIFNTAEGRWNIFYVGYEKDGYVHGVVFRDYSQTSGYNGLDGPYIDAEGTVLSYYDKIRDVWEGEQGADSFYPFKVGNTWSAFYGSAHVGSWDNGLANANSLADKWTRDSIPKPTFTFTENPIVQILPDGTYFAVMDDLHNGGYGSGNGHSIRYAYSNDGVKWIDKALSFTNPAWVNDMRTPQGLIYAGHGNEYWLFYTAYANGLHQSIGRMKVRINKSYRRDSVRSNGATFVELGSLRQESSSQGWGTLGINKSVSGTPLSVGGQKFESGLGTHAQSEIVYDVEDLSVKAFTARVGVDDAPKDHPSVKNASIVFQVFVDGEKKFDSGVMRIGDQAKPVNVDLTGAKILKLVVTDAGDGFSCDHADWAEAVLVLKKLEVGGQKAEAK